MYFHCTFVACSTINRCRRIQGVRRTLTLATPQKRNLFNVAQSISRDFLNFSPPPGCCDSDPAHHSWQLEDNALTFAPHVAAGPKLWPTGKTNRSTEINKEKRNKRRKHFLHWPIVRVCLLFTFASIVAAWNIATMASYISRILLH